MSDSNYCQNLWAQYELVAKARQNAAEALKVANSTGEINAFAQSLSELLRELTAMGEVWRKSFVALGDGKFIFGPEYAALMTAASEAGVTPQIDSFYPGSIEISNEGFIDAIMNGGEVVNYYKFLKHFSRLRKIYLSGKSITDISILEEMPALEWVFLGRVPAINTDEGKAVIERLKQKGVTVLI